MGNKNNIQDMVLNSARKEKMEITIYLMNGVPLKGRVVSFDNFTIVIENDGKQSLVYKHAISTIILARSIQIQAEEESSESK
ncbi:MAG TPA: RNA chaperone Hfq [Leptospiraceae bacterium]|nr:RNA chaperone Hfq [Leptospiraceae bacterium]MBR31098.1 RNA chaperone Hfq [Spirochaetaceae bacterium]HBS04173.1 RNA chaperone Hfq [Leptospiraceae bacterium]|tara:strand:+ start:12705 stop:12950 length:246 start_codon:yes stop_codon:yes gene_type:complete